MSLRFLLLLQWGQCMEGSDVLQIVTSRVPRVPTGVVASAADADGRRRSHTCTFTWVRISSKVRVLGLLSKLSAVRGKATLIQHGDVQIAVGKLVFDSRDWGLKSNPVGLECLLLRLFGSVLEGVTWTCKNDR